VASQHLAWQLEASVNCASLAKSGSNVLFLLAMAPKQYRVSVQKTIQKVSSEAMAKNAARRGDDRTLDTI